MNELQAKLARRRTLNNESAEVIQKEIKKTWDVQAELAGTSVVKERVSVAADSGSSPTLPMNAAEIAKQQQEYVRDQEKKSKEFMHTTGGEETTFQRKGSRTAESPSAATSSTAEADFKPEELIVDTSTDASEESDLPLSPERKRLQPRAVLQKSPQKAAGSGSEDDLDDMGFGFDLDPGGSASDEEGGAAPDVAAAIAAVEATTGAEIQEVAPELEPLVEGIAVTEVEGCSITIR
jgi:hypothetical protein